MKIIFTIFTIAILQFTFAQNINPLANTKLEQVKNFYQSKDNYKIKFQYELKNPKHNINQKEGGVLYTKNDKYNLSILGVNHIYDGNKLYEISDEDQEVTISSNNDGESITPTKIFDTYKKGFIIKKPQKGKLFNQSVEYIKLIPTDKKQKIKAIILAINPKTKELVLMKEYNKDGSYVIFTIQEFDYKTQLNSSLFTFNKEKYKDYFITDLD